MTNARHTQGPWLIRKNIQGTFDLFAEGGERIIGSYLLINHENNARLIAAAPDLLAALKAAADCLLGFHASDDFGPSDTEALNAAIAAIAKAQA